jgi:TolB-like protein
MDVPVVGETLAFEGWRFDPRAGGLLRQDPNGVWGPVQIGARARDILAFLVEHPGAVVSKDAIMDAAWPNVEVEPNNLTVQVAALRRVIDEGRAGDSCIQTVPGRGYRFVLRVTRLEEGHGGLTTARPRLSIVVLPIDNLSGEPRDEYLAEAITDDLTSDLSLIPHVSVIAREPASAYRGQPKDVQKIGEELRVRYVLKGSFWRFGSTLRVNVQLISAETGALLWSDRFDEELGKLALAEEQVVRRVKDELGTCLIEIENARSLRERPTNPDAFDLILRARSIRNQLPSRQRDDEAMALLERALVLDPSSVYAMTYIAFYLSYAAGGSDGWGSFQNMQRAERLLAQARANAPDSPVVLNTYLMWLRTVGRWAEVIDAAQRAMQMHPIRIRGLNGIYHELGRARLGQGKRRTGLPWRRKRTVSTRAAHGGTFAIAILAGTHCCWAGTWIRSSILRSPSL